MEPQPVAPRYPFREIYIPTEWRGQLTKMFDATAPYESLFKECGSETSEDSFALLDILQVSGVLDEPMRIASTMPVVMQREYLKQMYAAYNAGNREVLNRIRKEREKATGEMQKALDVSRTQAPLVWQLLGSAKVASRLSEYASTHFYGGKTRVEALKAAVSDPATTPEWRAVVESGLNLIFTSKDIAGIADFSRFVPDSQLVEQQKLYTSVDYQGEARNVFDINKRRTDVVVKSGPNKHPFIFAQATVEVQGFRGFSVNISRIDGKLILLGTTTARLSALVENQNFMNYVEQLIWHTINNGIAAGTLQEIRIEEKKTQDTIPEPPVKLVDEMPSESFQYVPYERRSVDVSSSESSPMVTPGRRLYIPPLNYRQLTRGCIRSGAHIASGGKHLKLVLNGRDTTLFNPHHGERQFYASNVYEILDALHIDPELFLSKI